MFTYTENDIESHINTQSRNQYMTQKHEDTFKHLQNLQRQKKYIFSKRRSKFKESQCLCWSVWHYLYCWGPHSLTSFIYIYIYIWIDWLTFCIHPPNRSRGPLGDPGVFLDVQQGVFRPPWVTPGPPLAAAHADPDISCNGLHGHGAAWTRLWHCINESMNQCMYIYIYIYIYIYKHIYIYT